MFNDSPNRPKIITNNVGGASSATTSNADGNKLSASVHDRGRSSWGQEQVNTQQPPTYRLGTGQAAKFVTGNANSVARSLPNKDPRLIPQINAQYVNDMYGGNNLKLMPSKKEVAKLKSVQLSRDKARGNMNEPMIAGGAFGARSNEETAMQKRRLRTWNEDQDTGGPLPGIDVRTYK